MSFSLTLRFDSAVLPQLRQAGLMVALAQQFSEREGAFIWLAMLPDDPLVITWEESFRFYATSAPTYSDPPPPGTVISEKSDPLEGGYLYPFTNARKFGGKQAAPIGGETYATSNQVAYDAFPLLSFGLLHSATVNGAALPDLPATLDPVLSRQTLALTPINRIVVWLEKNVKTATLIRTVTGETTEVAYGLSTFAIQLAYDAKSGRFTQG